jgi:hypothetical protein
MITRSYCGFCCAIVVKSSRLPSTPSHEDLIKRMQSSERTDGLRRFLKAKGSERIRHSGSQW